MCVSMSVRGTPLCIVCAHEDCLHKPCKMRYVKSSVYEPYLCFSLFAFERKSTFVYFSLYMRVHVCVYVSVCTSPGAR